ncbi:MAG: phenylalanine--tRNA ligase subunit beta [Candidatus Spechtbacterales bacterium]
MKFSYNFIQQYVDKKLPAPNKLAELLTMHAYEVEGVEKKGADHILDIDILPNRAHDSASHIGIAREAALLSGGALKLKKYPALKTSKNKVEGLSVDVKDPGLCPRYMAVKIEGVKVRPSPKWLKDALENIGINSINNIVDAGNYAMLATGQPLHVFDYDKLEGHKIVVRKAGKGESVTTLDNAKYDLEESILVIADEKDPLAIAGVKGGKKAEVDKNTQNIVIESANFTPVNIRNTTRKLALHTDASWRFEHEVPLAFAKEGLQFVVELILDIAGGNADKTAIDTLEKEITHSKIKTDINRASSLLGVEVKISDAKKILKGLGFDVRQEKEFLTVIPPYFRLDIEREVDVIEEIGRILGYENTEPKMPRAALYPPKRNVKNYWLRQINRHMAASGFNEVYNYVFVSENIFKLWGFQKSEVWELQNPSNDEFKYMRPSIAPLALKTARENIKFYDKVKFFETGEVFYRYTGKEEARLSLSIASRQDNREYFYELKGEVEDLFHSIGISDIWLDPVLDKNEETALSYLHSNRRALVKSGDSILGYIGQVHPAIAEEEGLKGVLFIADIQLSKLIELAEEEEIYNPVSSFPQVVRDVSLIVPLQTRAEEVVGIINTTGGKLLRDVDMFDYYEEDSNTESKSMAFHLVFQAYDRTLRSEEVDKIMEKIIKEIKTREGWEIK